MKALSRDRYELSLYCLKAHRDSSSGRVMRLMDFRQAGIRVRFPRTRETTAQTIGRLRDWIDQDGIDVLHTHSYQPNLLARMAGILSGRRPLRIVAHYHNYYDDKWNAEGTLALDRRLAQASDRLIACSEAVRSHVSERLDVPVASIEVILNGVDHARFAPPHDVAAFRSSLGISQGARVIASVGRLSRQKASDDVVRAARKICDMRPDCVFVMAGADDDPFSPTVRRLASDLGVDKRIVFTGHLSDVAPLYGLADVVVMPSRWEGFGLVLVEAMASGTPLVTTTVGPIPEVVGEGSALFVAPDSPAELASAVLRILDDPALAGSLAEKGRARARIFSWKTAGARLDSLYAALAQETYA
jgi:glycosyltransferase involved in cell wall biosynthesis